MAQILGIWVTYVQSKWCHYVMVESDSHLKLLPPSISDIYKLFEHFDMLSIGIRYQPCYTVIHLTWLRFWGSGSLMWSKNDVITSWLRLTATSNCFPHPYLTFTEYLSILTCLESPTSPRQALWGCCMPQRTREGSGARQKPKTNLETDEFASNPPFSKIYPISGGNNHKFPNFRQERWIKKIENLEFLKKCYIPELLQENFFK